MVTGDRHRSSTEFGTTSTVTPTRDWNGPPLPAIRLDKEGWVEVLGRLRSARVIYFSCPPGGPAPAAARCGTEPRSSSPASAQYWPASAASTHAAGPEGGGH